MTERELERRLRDFYRGQAEAGGPLVPAELRESVWSIPDDTPAGAGLFQTRRGVVLLAAAILTALLVAGAVAVGARILRPPWERNDWTTVVTGVSSEVLAPIACDETLPEGLLLTVHSQDNNLVDGFLLYADGLLLRGHEDLDTATATWSQRRLSRTGVEQLLAAVAASGLADCISVPAPGPRVEVKARLEGGVIATTLGSRGWLRAVTASEVAAATELAERLADPDYGVPATGWIQRVWEPYEHERWEIRLSRWEGVGSYGEGVQQAQWRDTILPDGTSFLTFGAPVSVEPGSEFIEHRCRVVEPAEASQMAEFLGTPVSMESPDAYGFRDRTGGVLVRLTSLLPHEPGCSYLGSTPKPQLPRENVIESVEACDYVPKEVLPMTNASEYEEFGGGWAACEGWMGGGGWVFASLFKVSRADATPIVETQFGAQGFTTEEIAGNLVYLNACAASDAVCSPAVAISVEPHFIIVVPDRGQGANLREIALAVIERLKG